MPRQVLPGICGIQTIFFPFFMAVSIPPDLPVMLSRSDFHPQATPPTVNFSRERVATTSSCPRQRRSRILLSQPHFSVELHDIIALLEFRGCEVPLAFVAPL